MKAFLAQGAAADAAKFLSISTWGLYKRLRQFGKDATEVERLAQDPWPVIFQEAVLEGNTTLKYPTQPFYAAVPLQDQTPEQWGLSIGRQKTRRKTSTIPVRILEEGPL